MLWERAKTLCIIFFLLLNIALAFLHYNESKQYVLTPEQERLVYQMLRQNQINIYCRLIHEYPPMRPLSVSDYQYDMDALISLLFDEPHEVVDIQTSAEEEYYDGTARLTLSNGYITYDCPDGFKPRANVSVLGMDEAVMLCDTFVQQYDTNFVLDASGMVDLADGWRIPYRENFQKSIVHTNFIEFLVTEKGIEQIDMQYRPLHGFTGPAQAICSPDEALLTFIQHVRVLYNDTPVIIKNMDLVYYQDKAQALPYYRIFIESQEVPFLINAYTNTLR